MPKDSPVLINELIPVSWVSPVTLGSAAYGIELPRSKRCAAMVLARLEELEFVDLATRIIVFEFNLYNRNEDLYSFLRISFSFDPTGHVEKYARIDAVKLMRKLFYVGIWSEFQPLTGGISDWAPMRWPYFASIVVDVWLAFTAIQLLIELRDLLQRPDQYFKDVWNMYDILYATTAVIFFASCLDYRNLSIDFELALGVAHPSSDETTHEYNSKFGADLNKTALQIAAHTPVEGYVDTTKLRSAFREVKQYLALVMLIYIMRLFKFMRLSRQLSSVWRVVAGAMTELKGFLVVLFIIFSMYALFGIAMFGNLVREFHNLPSAYMTLMQFSIGDFGSVDYGTIKYNGNLIAPVFVISFMILICFVVVNMFIAIIMDAYETEKDNRAWWHKEREMLGRRFFKNFNVDSMLWRRTFGIFASMGKVMFPRWRLEVFDANEDAESETEVDTSSDGNPFLHEPESIGLRPDPRPGTTVRIHFARMFLDSHDNPITDVDSMTWRDHVAQHITRLKVAEQSAYEAAQVRKAPSWP